MADPRLTAFKDRIARIEDARAMGYGFEAAGTLGRAAGGTAPARARRLWAGVRSLLLLGPLGVLLKALAYVRIGAEAYHARLALLERGDGLDRLSATILAADPMTVWLAGQISRLLLALN